MFTDNPTIPAQLEVLLDVVHALRHRKATAESLRRMIQPKGLPNLTSNSKQFALHLSAALELQLVAEDGEGNLRLTNPGGGHFVAKAAILAAFDDIALANADVEKWAGRFYSFLIVRNHDQVGGRAEQDELTTLFMDSLPPEIDRANPMNTDKARALLRWYPYVGLGFVDPAGTFVPDPTERLRRALPGVWDGDNALSAEQFMQRLARCCPELDGGALFNEVALGAYSAAARRCTRALSIALRRLHDGRFLRLRCPADSIGWSLELGGTGPVAGEASNRFDSVERTNKG